MTVMRIQAAAAVCRLAGAAMVTALLAVVCAAPLSAQESAEVRVGIVTREMPMFFFKDATRTPIRQLEEGSRVRILAREGDWYRVTFTDPRFEEITGYVSVFGLRVLSALAAQELDDMPKGRVGQRGFVDASVLGFAQEGLNDPERLVADALVREEVQLKPARWFQMAGGLELRGNSHDQVDNDWNVDFNDRGIQRPRLAVRRLSASLAAGPITIDAGKQFIRWGKADILNPTDRFAPRDFMNGLDADVLAVWSLRTAVRVHDETIEVAYVPRFTPSRLPLFAQRWTVLPEEALGVPFVDRGSELPDDSQVGARWNHVGSAIEVSASVFDGFNHLPDLQTALTADGLELTRTFPRLRTYGADLTVPTRVVTLKGEVTLFKSPDSLSDEYALYVVELERQSGEWLFDGGYAGEYVTTTRGQVSFAAERGLAKSLIGRAAYTIGPKRSAAVEGVVRQDGMGAYVKGEYSEGFGQHFRITVNAVGLRGDTGTFLGQFRRNSHVTANLRVSF